LGQADHNWARVHPSPDSLGIDLDRKAGGEGHSFNRHAASIRGYADTCCFGSPQRVAELWVSTLVGREDLRVLALHDEYDARGAATSSARRQLTKVPGPPQSRRVWEERSITFYEGDTLGLDVAGARLIARAEIDSARPKAHFSSPDSERGELGKSSRRERTSDHLIRESCIEGHQNALMLH
jgi:hypothetical protein